MRWKSSTFDSDFSADFNADFNAVYFAQNFPGRDSCSLTEILFIS